MSINAPFLMILILGSYDPDTKDILNTLKFKIAEKYGGENVYVFLLDELELLISATSYAIVEYVDKNRAEVFTFTREGEPREQFEVCFKDKKELEEKISKQLLETLGIKEYSICNILNKLEKIMRMASAIVVIRDREETRGGEIAELMYGIMRDFKDKICVFKKEGIPISNMLMEFLDCYNVCMRTYRFKEDLVKEALRYLSYRLKEEKKKRIISP